MNLVRLIQNLNFFCKFNLNKTDHPICKFKMRLQHETQPIVNKNKSRQSTKLSNKHLGKRRTKTKQGSSQAIKHSLQLKFDAQNNRRSAQDGHSNRTILNQFVRKFIDFSTDVNNIPHIIPTCKDKNGVQNTLQMTKC